MAERRFEWGRGHWRLGGRTYLLGIVNLTPDSFSDGGQFVRPDDAMHQVESLCRQGADGIDLGAESTRPGHREISAEEEWNRLYPALRAIRTRYDGPISVDTQKAEIARRALAEGADIINDIWGATKDPDMAAVVADSRAGLIMMYNRLPPFPEGAVSVQDIYDWFVRQIGRLKNLGVAETRMLIDPGLGFGYGVADNWAVLRRLSQLSGLGAGLLLGPSRKRFLGAVTGRPAPDRDAATAAVCALAVGQGVDVVRVHRADMVKDALAVADAWVRDHA